MAEEQISPAPKSKLPIKTKVAVWLLLTVAAIVVVLSIVLFFGMVGDSNPDISTYATMPLLCGFGIAIPYFLPGIFLLVSRSMWAWILSVAIICVGMLIPFVILLRNLFQYSSWEFPSNYLWGPYETVCVCFIISFLIPLILVLLDKLSYKFVVLIPMVLLIIAFSCFWSVYSPIAARENQVLDQAIAFQTRMETEFRDLYVQAAQDWEIKGCQGCEEVNQYFNEQWNQLDQEVRLELSTAEENIEVHDSCLEYGAYITKNASLCESIYTEGGRLDCNQSVQALIANNVSLCRGFYPCVVIFSIITDDPSVCDQVVLDYSQAACRERYNESQEDPYAYLLRYLGISPFQY